MAEEKLRLHRLLEHWIEHSKEHQISFTEWAEKAEKMGLSSASASLAQAVRKMDEVVQNLQKACKETV